MPSLPLPRIPEGRSRGLKSLRPSTPTQPAARSRYPKRLFRMLSADLLLLFLVLNPVGPRLPRGAELPKAATASYPGCGGRWPWPAARCLVAGSERRRGTDDEAARRGRQRGGRGVSRAPRLLARSARPAWRLGSLAASPLACFCLASRHPCVTRGLGRRAKGLC